MSASNTTWYGSTTGYRPTRPPGAARGSAPGTPRYACPPSDARRARRGHAASQPRHCTHSYIGGRTTRRSARRAVLDRHASPRCGRTVTRTRDRSRDRSGNAGGRSPHNARDEHVVVEIEGRHRVTGALTAGAGPVHLPVGSNASLIRAWSGVRRAPPNRRCPYLPLPATTSRQSDERASALSKRRPAESAATCTVPTPLSATSARAGPSRSGTTRDRVRRRPRSDRDTGRRAARARRTTLPNRLAERSASRSGATNLRSNTSTQSRRRTTPTTGRNSADATGPTGDVVDAHARVLPHAAAAAQDHPGNHAEGPERTDQQPRHVVAGHVLHRRAAAFHQAPVGRHETGSSSTVSRTGPWRRRRVPESPTASVPPTVAASNGRGSSRHNCPCSPSTRPISVTEVPAPHGDGHVLGFVVDDAGRRAHFLRAGHAAPPSSHCVCAPTATTAGASATAARSALRSTCPPAPAAAPRSDCRSGAP